MALRTVVFPSYFTLYPNLRFICNKFFDILCFGDLILCLLYTKKKRKMSDESEYEKYVKDSRTACKYGTKCYQKNPMHHKKYKHPPNKVS